MSATAARLYTADELLYLPDEPGVRHELVDGALVVMSPAGGGHGRVGIRLAAALENFAGARGSGDAFGPDTGFIIRRSPDTVRAPDASFVCAGRLPDGDLPTGYLPVAPDLAAEVVSPSDRMSEVGAKVAEYFAAGTRLVWVLNPRDRTVTVHEASGARRVLGEHDTLDGGGVLPGFSCPVAPLFARVRRA